ncbi:telomerase reverse transcriptase isoform X2 [Malania oleifera]|uniref:telomerase reverse transcriptase isoform X2 n=1 Tax=Malania oleifera TaxID=397392 RepID=UPI0025AE17C5|nr:telomerase reverse transcriptase isoform X2 [Malania oleifera]
MGKKRRVPEALWRLFRNRARTLAETILLMIPPSTSAECDCAGRRCLCCSGSDALFFLLRPDDPSDYRKLLTQCFVVVSLNAPPLSLPRRPDSLWSQHQIVARTIELIMCGQSVSSNVICSGYDKCNRSSPILELLTCSAWDLLLRRVGDDFMAYLLKYSSIFLPLGPKSHHQVAGPPIIDLCPRFSKCISESKRQYPSLVDFGPWKKRKKHDGIVTEKQPISSSYGIDGPRNSDMCFGFDSRSHSLEVSGHCRNSAKPTTETGTTNNEGVSNGELVQCSNQTPMKSKKRFRLFRWQRQRKRRQLNFQETNLLNPFTTVCSNKDSLSGRLQCCFDASLSHYYEKTPWQCCCCLFLHAPRKINKGAQINRQMIFYSWERSLSVFPRKHKLYSLKPNFSGADFLIRDIFGLSDVTAQAMPCFHYRGCCSAGSLCLYHSFLKLFKILIRKSQYCQHSRLLDKHCAVRALDQNADSKSEGSECLRVQEKILQLQQYVRFNSKSCRKTVKALCHQSESNRYYCLKSEVVSFIWAVCRSIVPEDLLGTASNWRNLRRNISKFVHLRRYEKFSLKQCLHKLKASRFLVLSSKHSSSCMISHIQKYTRGHLHEHKPCCKLNECPRITKHELLERWIYWFFSYLVVPLVQANFYVTESEHGEKDVFYYPKSVWENLTNHALTSLTNKRYSVLDAASVRRIISNRSFGFSALRLRPKENGVRALANLQAPSKVPVMTVKDRCSEMHKKSQCHTKIVKSYRSKSVNFVLHDLHVVLKGLRMKAPEKLGSSVFDYNDVYRKLCPFVIGLKKRSSRLPDVFIVVSDVQKAFDSIDQDFLLSIMNDVIQKDDYLLKQSQQVVCTKKSLSVYKNQILADQSFSLGCKNVSSAPSHSLHCVLTDQGRSWNVRKEKLLFTLKEHVKCNVLQLDKNFYLQNVGIPQGSVLSSLLCSFYYGHLEKNVVFPFLEKTREPAMEELYGDYSHHDASASKYMLLRFIDDFLFISTSKKQAASFFCRMQRGFREYNCCMNEKKFSLNFDIDHLPQCPSNRFYAMENGVAFLRWSGLLINCCTLEVQADYTRYLDNHLSTTLTVRWHGKPVDCLRERMFDVMRPKCHPIFYDSNINSAAVVRLNVYQAFLLCAMKFHSYVCNLSKFCSVHTRSYLDIISRSLRYMHKHIKKRVFAVDHGSSFRPILQLEKGEVEWLGLNAYISVLKRKQSRHKKLLSLLRYKLSVYNKAGSLSSPLKYAVDDSHSSLIWRIKY